MPKEQRIVNQLAEGLNSVGNVLPGQPIIEILGAERVLIENHLGIREYGREKIAVTAKFGLIIISGDHMELRQMTKEQLVISGKINSIFLQTRVKP